MAKVKGPLLSMDARGQLGKSLVFLGWKGIKTVRSHVVPANPRTTDQVTQRGFMSAVVAQWHSCQFVPLDLTAYNLAASLQAKVMSGFNHFCKSAIDGLVAGLNVIYGFLFVITTNTGGTLSFSAMFKNTITTVSYQLGTSTTEWGPVTALTPMGGMEHGVSIVGMVADTDVYIRFVPSVGTDAVVSGIYKVRILA